MPRRTPFALLLAASALMAGACADANAPAGVQMVDSSGVALVLAPRSVMEALPVWTTETELELGSTDDGPAAFAAVLGVHRRSDGGVVVLDAGNQELRYFGPDGTYETSVGGEGDGPGEFRTPARLMPMAGDSLLVWDQSLNRITVVGPDRTVARTAPLEGTPTTGLLQGLLDGGPLVFTQPGTELPTATAPVMRDTHLRVHTPDGAVSDSLGPFPLAPWYRTERGYASPVFGPSTDFATAGDGIWVAPSSAAEMVRVDTRGSLTRIVRWGAAERPVSQALRDRVLEASLDRAGSANDSAMAREAHGRRLFAPRLPFYNRVFTDATGAVWVEGYNPDPDREATTWTVFEADGRPAGRLELPGRFRLWEVRDDRLSGVLFGEMDVPRVVVWRVTRP